MLEGQRKGTQTPTRSGLLANRCGCVAHAQVLGPRGGFRAEFCMAQNLTYFNGET